MTVAIRAAQARTAPVEDQAAGLRRLFAQPATRLLPVLAGTATTGQGRWLAQLGESFARAGQRTVLVDAARMQIASAFGLRARFDLLHALDGDCRMEDVMLDAAPGLTVVPAARACERALEDGVAATALLAPVLRRNADVVLVLLPASGARLAAAGDMLVPVLPTRASVAAAVAAISEAAKAAGTRTFRLLFLAMNAAAAATLETRMAESIGLRSRVALAPGVVAPLARDLARVVAAASGFSLLSLARAGQSIGGGDFK